MRLAIAVLVLAAAACGSVLPDEVNRPCVTSTDCEYCGCEALPGVGSHCMMRVADQTAPRCPEGSVTLVYGDSARGLTTPYFCEAICDSDSDCKWAARCLGRVCQPQAI